MGKPAAQRPADRVTMAAHAKINLALAVDRPLSDGPCAGMHPIASWMAPIDLADTVTVERADASSCDITWSDGDPVEWPLERDLAARAHAAMEDEFGPLPARITVRKSIPAGGGLGGGSTDAGAVLRALNHLFALGLGADRLRTIAATLGSDIPFFIPDDPDPASPLAPALVTGLGERIERVGVCDPAHPGAAIPLLLIFPPFACPTGEVYRAFDEHPPAHFRGDDVEAIARAGVCDTTVLFNDLAAPAIAIRPDLGVLRADLRRHLGRPVHVSGSGSTLFCLHATPDDCARFLPDGCTAIASSVLSSGS
jgi:4-diphosphocytidyl-2-C-methyl-D-erythritol kinase